MSDVSIPGLRIERDPTHPDAWWVTAAHDPSWRTMPEARAGSDAAQILHPTAFLYAGSDYAADLRTSAPGGGACYHLVPWPDGERRVWIVELSAEAFALAAEEELRLRREELLARHSIWYDFLPGFLPARIQRLLEDVLRIDPGGATARSGMVELQLGLLLGIISTVMMFASARGAQLTIWGDMNVAWLMTAVPLWMMGEGVSRYSWGQSDVPCGLLVLEMVDWLWLHAWQAARPDRPA